MPILTIRHVTTYHYKQPVAFGEHRMMLRPRDDNDQKVLESELEITPEPTELTWTQDIFGNHVAAARFADRASASLRKHHYVDHRRLASGRPISRILPGPIRLPMRRKIGPLPHCHRTGPRPPSSIAGRPGSSARTDRPTPASFSST
jgi:hypothetical protein